MGLKYAIGELRLVLVYSIYPGKVHIKDHSLAFSSMFIPIWPARYRGKQCIQNWSRTDYDHELVFGSQFDSKAFAHWAQNLGRPHTLYLKLFSRLSFFWSEHNSYCILSSFKNSGNYFQGTCMRSEPLVLSSRIYVKNTWRHGFNMDLFLIANWFCNRYLFRG
jgi:hypothetical protein